MGKNLIVSEETVRDLLEAHASLSAWYYALWEAVRAHQASASPPDDAARAAFAARLAVDFPELSSVARQIGVPRAFVPPPIVQAPPPHVASSSDEQATLIEPAPARLRQALAPLEPAAVPPPAAPGEVAPPPLVNPSNVKYSS